jgi:hypothetical protein
MAILVQVTWTLTPPMTTKPYIMRKNALSSISEHATDDKYSRSALSGWPRRIRADEESAGDTQQNSGYHEWKEKNGCNNIHTPTHIHLNQLLDAVKVFHKWKKNCEEKEHFVPESTCEDLCWMVFAVVGVAKTYVY